MRFLRAAGHQPDLGYPGMYPVALSFETLEGRK
jgi:hypothetical protein